ncbi:hypothetical protein D3C72_858330 [compost metagenome]
MGLLQGRRRKRQPTRCLADAEIDPAGRKRRQDVENLGNLVRAIVLQHDAARANPDAGGLRQYPCNQRLRCGTGKLRRIVMFSHPETAVTQLFSAFGKIDRVAERARGVLPR